MRINQEEIFGPIASVIAVDRYEEALQVANDTEFGLTAGIITRSSKHAEHFRRNAAAGVVTVNTATVGLDFHVPFGGTKRSSYGLREQGTYAREFYTDTRIAYVAS
jgi:aldehyde dehydrogenase (NAD+)